MNGNANRYISTSITVLHSLVSDQINNNKIQISKIKCDEYKQKQTETEHYYWTTQVCLSFMVFDLFSVKIHIKPVTFPEVVH